MTVSNTFDTPMLTAFIDEVEQTQKTFRHLLTAMSEPASILTLDEPAAHKENIDTVSMPTSENNEVTAATKEQLAAIWAVAQTILDSEVSVYVDNSLHETFKKSIRFFTGVLLVDEPNKADYLFIEISNLECLLNNYELNVGTLEKPHTNSTLVILTKHITRVLLPDDNELLLQVTGPGIQSKRDICIAGVNEQIVSHFQNYQQLFPCGIDWIFCANNIIAALPRTSKVVVKQPTH